MEFWKCTGPSEELTISATAAGLIFSDKVKDFSELAFDDEAAEAEAAAQVRGLTPIATLPAQVSNHVLGYLLALTLPFYEVRRG